MTAKLSPALQGLITGLIMIAAALWIDNRKETINPNAQYVVYVIYAAGILWALVTYSRSPSFSGTFAGLFNRGFRCFIVVSLLMVIFTVIFLKLHPEFAEQEAIATKEYYLKEGSKTPAEIQETTKKAKKRYPVIVISLSIFRYLLIGAGTTAILSAFFTRRK